MYSRESDSFKSTSIRQTDNSERDDLENSMYTDSSPADTSTNEYESGRRAVGAVRSIRVTVS